MDHCSGGFRICLSYRTLRIGEKSVGFVVLRSVRFGPESGFGSGWSRLRFASEPRFGLGAESGPGRV